jgi:carbon-monoxide dehydrogenase small subunit
MTKITCRVNGAEVCDDVAPRLHLADFLRETLLLTGTHLGCEHGVCGACTILLDGEPARSCITFAATCDNADIRTIEGLEDDVVAQRLRVAFTAHHALQCGYCTPGMMVTARDIVHRLPDATDDDIRLELAGNLCRCTGYNGIVRAIRQVLDERLDLLATPQPKVPAVTFGTVAATLSTTAPVTGGTGLHQRLPFAATPAELWAMLRDPQAIVSCVPGASFTTVDGDHVTGEIVVALGPVRARFAGDAVLTYDDARMSGAVRGAGQDQSSGTRLSAEAAFRVEADAAGALLAVDIRYDLKGPLAQLAKARVVALLADEISGIFATNLKARLAGGATPPRAPLYAFGLVVGVVKSWFWRRRRD